MSNEKAGANSERRTAAVPAYRAGVVVEVMSPSDSLRAAQRKMLRWIANGVELGWLIDADNSTVHVYRAGQEPRQMRELEQIEGEGPIEGLVSI